MIERCEKCGDWLEYTDTDIDFDGNEVDVYVCINCGRAYVEVR